MISNANAQTNKTTINWYHKWCDLAIRIFDMLAADSSISYATIKVSLIWLQLCIVQSPAYAMISANSNNQM